jgi:hypothetical protein
VRVSIAEQETGLQEQEIRDSHGEPRLNIQYIHGHGPELDEI